jgi:secondary thiamine-phosphate synthase enzyme|tara:strand:- start:1173 stop:1571 length:399 start_codon:yes stop_codon:yes gene_type:complete
MIDKVPISTSKKQELVDITLKISSIVKKSNIKEGLCIVYCPHTTAGITINENADPDVQHDILQKLASLIPQNENYQHSEGNSDAHIKSSLLGNEKTIIINNNKLVLGTWQGIYFFEGDGPRERKVIIKIIEG